MVIYNLYWFNSFQIQLLLELDTDFASTYCPSGCKNILWLPDAVGSSC